jgi:hypothetical protein
MLTTIIMIRSKFTDRFIRFLALKSFVLIIALISYTQTFAEELDISDIEKALSAELKVEPDKSLIVESDPSNAKVSTVKPLEDKKITSGEISTEQKNSTLTNSIGESPFPEKIEPLPQADKGKLIILNKITTKSTEHVLKIGEVKFFGNLSIELHKCIKATDPYNSNNWMLLTIFDNKIEEENLSVFHGWVLSSNPSLSTLEHPVYEVIPLDCLVSDKK